MKSNALKVGVLTLLVLAGTFYAIKSIYKGALPWQGQKGYKLWALFKDATGLVPKSRVQIAGINIGSISAFFQPSE